MSEARSPEELLTSVGELLARLPRRVVFIGGATTGLYLTDPAAPSVRSTTDVDVVVDVASYAEYSGLLRDALRRLGAREDTREDAPLCRWTLAEVSVDVMRPASECSASPIAGTPASSRTPSRTRCETAPRSS